MATLKQFLKTPKMVSRRLLSSVPIRRFDRRSDAGRNTRGGGDLALGYMKTTIDSLLDMPGLTQRMIDSELHVRPDPALRVYFNWAIPAFLWQAILQSRPLQTLVSDYLGPRVRLDDLYVKTVMDGMASGSEGWHDDNVGYRLKVFMVFDTEGQPSGTVVIPGARPKLYNVRVVDEVSRFLFTKRTDDREGATRIAYQRGDCLVFDTNLPHRGDYSSGEGVRFCVIAEFIDRDKANAIVGRTPCGPGQGRRQIPIPPLAGISVPTHPLLDPKLLHQDGPGWRYGYGPGRSDG